ncbi:MAG: rod shape-determining protein MreC, partial [Woeseiaceae bacterium]|nr:rod shape-determining protein MreC [Woeseiaceae bacterium]
GVTVARGSNTNPARIPALGLRTLALLFMSMLLMYLDQRENHLDGIRAAISAAVYPMRVVVDAPVSFWQWASETSASRDELRRENELLKAERLVTRGRLQQLSALEAENARLRAMLEASHAIQIDVRVAEILSVDMNPFRHTLVIDAGGNDGVYEGQAIIGADGVVGQVMSTGPMTAQALLISDPGHALPVEVNRNGLRTIAYGTGDFGRLDLPGLPNNADIEVGDLLVTSGLGGVFPSGYPVAEVTSVTRIPQEPFADVSARPTVALAQVREVMLIYKTPRAAPAETAAGENSDE